MRYQHECSLRPGLQLTRSFVVAHVNPVLIVDAALCVPPFHLCHYVILDAVFRVLLIQIMTCRAARSGTVGNILSGYGSSGTCGSKVL